MTFWSHLSDLVGPFSASPTAFAGLRIDLGGFGAKYFFVDAPGRFGLTDFFRGLSGFLTGLFSLPPGLFSLAGLFLVSWTVSR